jgi:hypothetical protein
MAELPKHYEVVKHPGTDFIYEWWPVIFDGPVCRDEHEALMECHRHRNAVRAELLRELAAELRTGTGDLSDAIGDSGSFFGPKRYPEETLDERADALEKGTPP